MYFFPQTGRNFPEDVLCWRLHNPMISNRDKALDRIPAYTPKKSFS